ncbi:preprotein translocase subunit SecE [Sphingomonas sp. SORGH_AS802]|nr:preprotein translocase subunit SecE [Sphingomonas sp. SORGH_AS_0438]MDR6135829.1 preprotein translocase subunit SecE [Sphingomonas sp. SORGH_AS_0802]
MVPCLPIVQFHGLNQVAKTTPVEFINQVKVETKKVSWPSWKETWMTGLMVVIMTTILALFFLGVDSFFNAVVTALLKLAQ